MIGSSLQGVPIPPTTKTLNIGLIHNAGIPCHFQGWLEGDRTFDPLRLMRKLHFGE